MYKAAQFVLRWLLTAEQLEVVLLGGGSIVEGEFNDN